MNKEDLQEAFQLLPDDLVVAGLEDNPHIAQRNRRRTMTRWISSAAACLVLVVGSILFTNGIADKSKSVNSMTDTVANTPGQAEWEEKNDLPETPAVSEITQPSSANHYHGASPQETVDRTDDALFREAEALLADFSMKASALALSDAADSEQNLLFSPEGFFNCLAMACAGSDDASREELIRIMGADSMQDLDNLMALRMGRQFRTGESTFRLGLSVWADDSLGTVREDYIKRLRQWNGEVHQGKMDSQKMLEQIMDWTAAQTDGRSGFEPDPMSLLTFLSTVYYADLWMEPFEMDKIRNGSFTLPDGQTVETSFMCDTDWGYTAWEGEDYYRASRDFRNGQMVFVLPKEGTDPAALCENAEVLQDVFFGGDEVKAVIRWEVPRFTMDAETDMTALAAELGLGSLFNGEGSYTSVAENATGLEGKITQHCYLRIDEKGVEAGDTTAAQVSAAFPFVDMVLTRPFLYGILDHQDRIIFMGICNNPTVSE